MNGLIITTPILIVNSLLGWRLNGGNSKTTSCVSGSLLVSLYFLNPSYLLIEQSAMGIELYIDISSSFYYYTHYTHFKHYLYGKSACIFNTMRLHVAIFSAAPSTGDA